MRRRLDDADGDGHYHTTSESERQATAASAEATFRHYLRMMKDETSLRAMINKEFSIGRISATEHAAQLF